MGGCPGVKIGTWRTGDVSSQPKAAQVIVWTSIWQCSFWLSLSTNLKRGPSLKTTHAQTTKVSQLMFLQNWIGIDCQNFGQEHGLKDRSHVRLISWRRCSNLKAWATGCLTLSNQQTTCIGRQMISTHHRNKLSGNRAKDHEAVIHHGLETNNVGSPAQRLKRNLIVLPSWPPSHDGFCDEKAWIMSGGEDTAACELSCSAFVRPI